MPCDDEDWVAEVERGVQMIVVQDDRRREDYPNRYDSGSRNLGLLSRSLNGDWRRQLLVSVLLCGQELIGLLNKRLLFEILVSRLLGGHGCICARIRRKVESDGADERGRRDSDVEETS
jgi:hypothetical protein